VGGLFAGDQNVAHGDQILFVTIKPRLEIHEVSPDHLLWAANLC
jgi:hypothetical protein